MKKRKRANKVLLLLILCIVPLLQVKAAQVIYKPPRPMKNAGDTGITAKVEEPKKHVAYFYDPRGKTDPFKPFIAEKEEVAAEKKQRPKTYLETVDLSQLELIAVIVSSKGKWAMVRDSKGTGHVIREGTPIGTNGGKVALITDRGVVIREKYRDFRGNTKYREIAKKVPEIR